MLKSLLNFFSSSYKLLLSCGIFFLIIAGATAQSADFSKAEIVRAEGNYPGIQLASEILKDMIFEKTGIRSPLTTEINAGQKPSFVILRKDQHDFLPEGVRKKTDALLQTDREGYKVLYDSALNLTIVLGNDDRGVLYGVGYLLRKMELRKGEIRIPGDLSVSSSPAYPIRGHQLGYRPKTNAYDAWTVEEFDHYIRDLAIFGANSIEITPDKSDDEFENPHMVLPAIEMMAEQSRIGRKYEMDVWLWYPNMGTDYTHPDSIQKELEDHARIFKALPALDHLFVPGGDPGDLHPKILFNWLKKLVVGLHQYHPQAKIWVSPQVFRPSEEWYEAFYHEVNQGYPWFAGVVYGPWVKETLREVRERVRPDLPVRRYPDITHSLLSQYPVAEWDLAYAITLDREPYNPRPIAEKHIHNIFAEYGNGSISYSEGINDDVNKFVWSDQDWNPSIPVKETLRDYARLFIGPDYTETVAEGLLALEENFKGPLLVNRSVQKTLQQWQDMESRASQEVLNNYRFQMGLLRAYYDAYLQRRLIYEKGLEEKALDHLRAASKTGSERAMRKAEKILKEGRKNFVRPDLRERCLELSEAVFKSIKSQLTSREPIIAEEGRGNFIDNIDLPVNDSEWILARLQQIGEIKSETGRLEEIRRMLDRTNPGPGGFYDNLGSTGSWEHVVRQKTWEEDPIGLESPFADFGASYQGDQWIEILPKGFGEGAVPHAWMTQFTTLYDTPLKMRYTDLDPGSTYKIQVTYSGRFNSHLKLVANDRFIIHEHMETGTKPVFEFPIPKEATRSGTLNLTWTCLPGERGSQVAEVWIIREGDH